MKTYWDAFIDEMNKEFFIENNLSFILEIFYYYVTDNKKFYIKVVEYYKEKGDTYYAEKFTEELRRKYV